jgi:eukaryotic-like serine/threonine-protein kinase
MTRADRDESKVPPPPFTDRVDEACDRFEAAWLAGARPRIEDYLPETAGPERESYLRELLTLELAYRRRDKERPNYGEYASRFSEHRTVIAALFGMPTDHAVEGDSTERAQPATTAGEAAPASGARLTLEVKEGPHKGRTFSFEEHDSFIVGRSAQAHFQLSIKDRHFSRNHFLIEFNPPHCRLMDLGSTNGTLVNGKRVARTDLKEGDLIQGGTTTILVAIEQVGGKASAPPATVTYHGAQTASVAAAAITAAPIEPVAEEKITRPITRPSAGASSAPQPEVGASSASCRACGTTISGTGKGSQADGSRPGERSLCPTCSRAIDSQPQPIAGYEIIRELGRGGMGIVSLARRTSDDALIALKRAIPDVAATPEDIAKFLREARILFDLHHPHIVRCVDVGDSTGYVYFAMEYVPGRDAHRLMREAGGPLPVRRAARLTCQMLDALAFAHARRFVHRDIKPSNLLISGAEAEELLKLADFGLARIYQSSRLSGLTITGDIQGTPAFMPPEQITRYRDVLPTSDLYSAGATLYYLLTRKYVYDFPKRVELRLLKILEEDPVPIRSRRADLPGSLAEIIDRCLAREPEDRFPDAGSLREALDPFMRWDG